MVVVPVPVVILISALPLSKPQVALVVFSVLILVSLWLYKVIQMLAKSLIQIFSKLAKDKEGRK